MKKDTAPISLAGSQLGNLRHACAFFNTDDKRIACCSLIKDRFECGDKAVHIVRLYIDDLFEFESRVNDVWSSHGDTVTCTYDLRRGIREEYRPEKVAASISLTGSRLGETWHVCAFLNSQDDEYSVTLPFLKEGFDEAGRTRLLISTTNQYQSTMDVLRGSSSNKGEDCRRERAQMRSTLLLRLGDGCIDTQFG